MDQQSKKEQKDNYKQRKIIGGVYAIKNTVNGKKLLMSTTNLSSIKNRFEFSQQLGGCFNLKLQKDWDQFGKDKFVLEVLEELTKNELQTSKEFGDDVNVLRDIWMTKIDPAILY